MTLLRRASFKQEINIESVATATASSAEMVPLFPDVTVLFTFAFTDVLYASIGSDEASCTRRWSYVYVYLLLDRARTVFNSGLESVRSPRPTVSPPYTA